MLDLPLLRGLRGKYSVPDKLLYMDGAIEFDGRQRGPELANTPRHLSPLKLLSVP